MTLPRLLIRADAGGSIGGGHVMRCLALAQEWRDRGGEACFASFELPDRLRARLEHEGVTLHQLEEARQAAEVAAVADSVGAAWVVVDGYGFGGDYQRGAAGRSAQVLVIDDYGSTASWDADLLLDQNLGVEATCYPTVSSDACLLGPRFVLLRREIRAAISKRGQKIVGTVRRVLIAFGGSDPQGLTPAALEAVVQAGLEGATVVVLLGPAAPDAEQIAGRLQELAPFAEVLIDPSDYAQRVSTADLAIVAAGSTCWELAGLGVPAVVTAVAGNQLGVAASLAAAGAVVDIGPPGGWSVGELSTLLRQLAGDPNRRRSMASAGRELVDGLGADRVVAKMMARTYAASWAGGGRS